MFDSYGFSVEGTLISASAVPQQVKCPESERQEEDAGLRSGIQSRRRRTNRLKGPDPLSDSAVWPGLIRSVAMGVDQWNNVSRSNSRSVVLGQGANTDTTEHRSCAQQCLINLAVVEHKYTLAETALSCWYWANGRISERGYCYVVIPKQNDDSGIC